MKSQKLFISLFFLLSLSVSAQQPNATPPVDDEEDLIKISTSLIQVDVTVTDKKGNIVTDLKPEDFEVYENGKKQTITNFSFVAVDKPAENDRPQNAAKPDKTVIPIPPVRLKSEQVRRTYALVVDDLGVSFASAFWVKEALKKFVNEQMKDGDLVAILRTGGGVGALQSFTSDKRQLLAAINKIKFNPQSRTGVNTFETIRPDFNTLISPSGRSSSNNEDMDAEDFVKQLEEFRNENFAVGTLGALNYIIKGMRDLPGRKSVMLFSEGFRLTDARSGNLMTMNRILPALRVLADLANRSSVLIYTIDPRGLQDPTFASVADDTEQLSLFHPRAREFVEKQQSLQSLAYETGAFPYINQNDINSGIQRALDDQDSYYLLGYQPDDETFDPKKTKFNKLEVKVTRPGLRVRHRSGFFGVTDEKIQTVAQTPRQKLGSALLSPFGASDVNLSLYPIYTNEAKNGDMIQALVYIDTKDLEFSVDGEKRKANFDIVAMTFGDNGAAISEVSKNYTIEVSDQVYRSMLEKGFVYTLRVPIRKSGAYQFRVALRDTATNKIGAASQFIEIPNVKKRISVSNLLLDNFTPVEWEKIKTGAGSQSERSALLDTALRKFKRGTILRYDYEVYNPQRVQTLTARTRLIHDGKIIYEENPTAIKTEGQTDLTRFASFGAIDFGTKLKPGTYILQIVITDPSAKREKSFAAQFVEFDIVE